MIFFNFLFCIDTVIELWLFKDKFSGKHEYSHNKDCTSAVSTLLACTNNLCCFQIYSLNGLNKHAQK